MNELTPRIAVREDSDERLRELILYIAAKSADDDRFGNTKLNKLLFFSDFLAFELHGASITGTVYQKLDHGPAPRRLLPVRNRMIEEREAAVVEQGEAWPRKVTVAFRDANVDLFTPEQLALVDEVIQHFWNFTATQISETSHRVSLGWQLARDQEEIPYETALIPASEPRQEVIELAERRFAAG